MRNTETTRSIFFHDPPAAPDRPAPLATTIANIRSLFQTDHCRLSAAGASVCQACCMIQDDENEALRVPGML